MNLKNKFIDKINIKNKLSKKLMPIMLVLVTLSFIVLNISASISPDFVQGELGPGVCYPIETTVEIPVIPLDADVDVMFAFDLTTSMGDTLNIAKNKTGQIINTLIASYPGGSFTFGVMSHMDYPDTYESCGYGPIPYGVSSDYAYSLDQPLTDDTTTVITVIDNLILGEVGSADAPEDYARIFYESYADLNVGWRPEATKLLVNFGDNLPHDCNVREGITSGTWSTGSDPGRDEIMGTADDLDLQGVLAAMNSSGITLIECQKNSAYNFYWNYWTGITGGSVYITGSSSLVDDVISSITSGLPIPKVYNLTLEVTTSGYEDWLSSVVPSLYSEVVAGTNVTFEETICVQIDTSPGLYTFVVSAVDEDGVNYGNQTVVITVPNNPPEITTADVTYATEDVFYSVVYEAIDPDMGDMLTWSLSTDAVFLLITSDTGVLYGMPDNSDVGSYWVNVSVNDDYGGSDFSNFTLMVLNVNDPPNAPINPNPDDNATGISLNPILSVNVSDSDGDVMSVSFYNANGDIYIGTDNNVTSGEKASFIWSGRSYSKTYSWYAIANDSLLETTSDIWSFTTKSSPPPPPPPPSTKKDPTADAGGPYYGFVGEEIEFDGTGSKDNDESGESIEQYDWKFFTGDIWHEDIGENPTHTYNDTGEYTITLRVTDDEGKTATDTAKVYISIPSNPPIIILAEGPTTGDIITEYTYAVNSTDPDANDTIIYTFDWDDGTSTISDVLASNTSFNATHNWSTYGVYTVTITAEDSFGSQDTQTIIIYIDVLPIDGEINGYLVDEDSDDTYDLFDNTDTGEQIDVEQENGTYIIDIDGDGKHDYAYNTVTGLLAYFDYVYQKYYTIFQNEVSTPGFETISLLAMIALVFIILKRRKNR